MKKLKPISRVLIVVSALAMISAYYLPLWQILMWAPQYPEGLDMKIWIDNITGDVKIISALNHYIGMKHIEASMFPEFEYMIYIVAGMIGFGLLTAVVNKRFMLMLFTLLILAAGVAALVDFYLWGYDYGHNLDPAAPIIVPGMSYQPPVIGTKQLLNFTAYSGPDVGGWIFLAAGIVVTGTLVYEIYRSKKERKPGGTVTAACLMLVSLLVSCQASPEPLRFGKDNCHTCRMTLMDNKFGGEILTVKGKVYKFDDLNCMLRFYHSGEVPADKIKNILVIDFSQPEKLIDATAASYIQSEEIKSPMASHVAAFEKTGTLSQMNTQWKGTVLNWEGIKKSYE